MKRMKLKAAVAVFVIFMPVSAVYSQQNNPRYEFGVNFGMLLYQGDLTPEKLGAFRSKKFSLGIHADRILNASFSLKANFTIGKLKGDDALYSNPGYRQQRNFNFTSPVFEFSGLLVWNVNNNYSGKKFFPYVFGGAGLSFLKIKRNWSKINISYFNPESSDIWAGLAIDTVQRLPRVIPVAPVGVGVKYFFTTQLALNIESSYRFDFTDYLDGFSRAANPEKRDHYLNYSIGLICRRGKNSRLGCPVLKY